MYLWCCMINLFNDKRPILYLQSSSTGILPADGITIVCPQNLEDLPATQRKILIWWKNPKLSQLAKEIKYLWSVKLNSNESVQFLPLLPKPYGKHSHCLSIPFFSLDCMMYEVNIPPSPLDCETIKGGTCTCTCMHTLNWMWTEEIICLAQRQYSHNIKCHDWDLNQGPLSAPNLIISTTTEASFQKMGIISKSQQTEKKLLVFPWRF